MPVASAQDEAEQATPQLRLGPVGLNPFLRITDVGVDTNVDAASEAATRDVTARVTPGVTTSLRVRRAQLTVTSAIGFSYFKERTESRARDFSETGELRLLLNRLTPRVSAGYVASRQRPNLEIDARVRQTTQSLGLGADLRFGPRMTLGVDARQSRRQYDEGEQFGGRDLRTELEQDTRQAMVGLRLALTPLTTFVVAADVTADRFPPAPVRNADSIGAVAGFDLRPFALISGTVRVGFRSVRMLDDTVPDFRGLVGNVAVAYTFRQRTRIEAAGNRGIDYSFDQATPYYVTQGASLTVTEAIGRGFDVRGTFGGSTLVYQDRLASGLIQSGLTQVPRRGTDRMMTYGIGAGRRISATTRVGFDVFHASRRSPLALRTYDGWRAGGSFTYGS